MNQQTENQVKADEQLKAYLFSLGLNPSEVERIRSKARFYNVATIQNRINDYQTLLQTDLKTVLKIVLRYPRLLGLETFGAKPTSVQSKIRAYQDILHVDTAKVIKMVLNYPQMLSYDCISEKQKTLNVDRYPEQQDDFSATSVKAKISDLQTALQTNETNVAKMLSNSPEIIGLSIVDNIIPTLAFFREQLQIDQATLTQMLVKFPSLIKSSIKDGPTSVKSRIEKLREIIPAQQLRELIVKRPTLISVPTQSFKIRYMMAVNANALDAFLSRGFLVNEKNVWARYCYLTSNNPSVKSSKMGNMNVIRLNTNLYRENAVFEKRFGVKVKDLMQEFPLDELSVQDTVERFQRATGEELTLDSNERKALGINK